MSRLDSNALMAQAKKMKEEMGRIQADLKERMVEGRAGGGTVAVTANGNQEVVGIRIKPEAVDKDDLSLLEDLVLVAIRDALEKARKLNEEAMSKVTGGVGIPGLF